MSNYKSHWISINGKNNVNVLFSKLTGIPMNSSLYYRIKDMFGKENDSIGRMLLSYITSNDVEVKFSNDIRYVDGRYSPIGSSGVFHWEFDFNVNGIPIHIVRDLDVVDSGVLADADYLFIIPLFGRDTLMVSNSLMGDIVHKLHHIVLH